MSPESARGNSGSQNVDESFWAALFSEEESAPTPPPTFEDLSLDDESLFANTAQIKDTQSFSRPADPWATAQEAYEEDDTLSLTVTGFNKGGLLVEWHGLPGFIPASQLVNFPQFHVAAQRNHVLKEAVGTTLQVKIIEVNPRLNRLIFSERAALVDSGQRELVLASINPGDIVSGTVTNLTDFGAFVDLGGVEGLIHISELSWSRVIHPSKILQPDDIVEVLVLVIDQEKERVALSLKQLHQDPWLTAEDRYFQGQLVEGTISNIVNYGAFVLLERELEGLIHISELAEGDFLHPRNVVSIGEHVSAKVLYVDAKSKRLALTLREATPNE
ncbi:MAG: S1 RNA-binding domain-containing protein [Aquificales bacterium]|nr:S1 RNA-binding domain-containing protein [Aquificales bacterium]